MLQLPTSTCTLSLSSFSLTPFSVFVGSLGLYKPIKLHHKLATVPQSHRSMAKAVDDAGLWLPLQLLAGGDNNKESQNADSDAVFGFPSEFPYEFGVSSPVESVAGSTETESSDEEEVFLAGLTRRLSQATIHESRKHQLTPPITACHKPEVLTNAPTH